MIDTGSSLINLNKVDYYTFLKILNTVGECYNDAFSDQIICDDLDEKPDLIFNLCGNKFVIKGDDYISFDGF